ALIKAGEAHTLRVAGMEALDVARLEAGLIMAGVDYFSSRTAHHPSQAVSPYEIGFDRLVDLDKPSFIGKRALMDEVAAGGPPDRLVGLELDLNVFENAYLDLGYPIEHPLRAWRAARSRGIPHAALMRSAVNTSFGVPSAAIVPLERRITRENPSRTISSS
ncbi:aminomethyl transferase family protein, partial [bacterium]|nr:aminomethyl transferase family protein [bacterium]